MIEIMKSKRKTFDNATILTVLAENPLQITASCDEIEIERSSGLRSQEPIATCKRIYLMNFPENVEYYCNRGRGAFPVFDPHERCSHIDT